MRITSNKAHEQFERMVRFGTDAGVDMAGWRFGQLYGSTYYIEKPHHTYPDSHTQVGEFNTPREAFEFMAGMITGFWAVECSKTDKSDDIHIMVP